MEKTKKTKDLKVVTENKPPQEKTIYNLDLHEAILLTTRFGMASVTETIIIRVPGGWLYGSAFVPFTAEFRQTLKKK